MSFWIRSQDRQALIPINKMITNTCEGLFYDGIILGTYKSKERAIEVLDEIEDLLTIDLKINDSYYKVDTIIKAEILNSMIKVYEMPKE